MISYFAYLIALWKVWWVISKGIVDLHAEDVC